MRFGIPATRWAPTAAHAYYPMPRFEGANMRIADRLARRVTRQEVVVLGIALLAFAIGHTSSLAGGDQEAGCVAYEPSPSDAPIAALAAQIRDGGVGDAEITAAVNRALDAQRDQAGAWAPAWGEVLDAAWAAGKLSEEQKSEYARHSARFQLLVRPALMQGEAPAIALAMESRVGPARMFGLEIRVEAARIGEQEFVAAYQPSVSWAIAYRGSPPPRFLRSVMLRLNGTPAAGVADPNQLRCALGAQEVTLDARILVRDGVGPDNANLAAWHEHFVAAVQVVETDNSVSLIAPEAQREKMDGLFSFDSAIVTLNSYPLVCHGAASVKASSPVAFAFEVFLRAGDKEWPLSNFAGHPDDGAFSTGVVGSIDGFDTTTQRVDIILRPSARVARSTIDLTEIWGQEVVIHDVPVIVKDAMNPGR